MSQNPNEGPRFTPGPWKAASDCDAEWAAAYTSSAEKKLARAAYLAGMRKAAEIAHDPYGDAVRATAGDEPSAVAEKTYQAILRAAQEGAET